MISFPNAKINLGLNVVEKRADGFHNLETVFYPVALCDALEISTLDTSESYEFTTSGIPIDTNTNNDNIVVKAFELLAADFNLPATAIHLHKKIPFGAGLGGGSADAAFAIRLINDFYKLNLSIDQMEAYALELGSDCPFFIQNKPMYAEGKGEQLFPINLDLSNYYILMVKPDFSINTAKAFNGIIPRKSKIALKHICQQPVEEWRNVMQNDFEYSIFSYYPELQEIKEKLYEIGAVYAAMSGSGSTMYGLFTEAPSTELFESKYFAWSGKLL